MTLMQAGRGFAGGRRTWTVAGAWAWAWMAGAVVVVQGQDFVPPQRTPDGFLVPQPGRRFEFPRDHGRHDGFKIEWWIWTNKTLII
ncbi:MAG: hypothetical protein ACKOEQ_05605 [Verrucomicrobiota bacterium]